jgi:PAS domain S-box-containing protein
LQANRAASLLYGYTHEDLLTLKNTELSAEPEQTRKATEENPLDPDKIVMIPLRWHKRKDGTVFPVEITARLFERKGRSVHIAAIRDISQRKMAEATLLLQSTALHSAANAIIITDRQGRIEWANPAFSTLTGYSMDEAVGKKPGDLLKSGAHDQPFYQQMWDSIVSGETWTGEMLNRKKDGSLYSEEMTITPVKTDSGEITHFIAIKQDISERKRRERELETLATVSGALRNASTRADMFAIVLDQLIVLLNTDGAALVMRDTHTGESVLEAARGEFMEGLRERLPPGVGVSGKVIESGKPFVTQDISKEEGVAWSSVFEVVHAVAAVPLIVETQFIGALWIGRKGHINPAEIRLLTSIADIAANAIYRETSREETIQQLQRLATLRSIDQLITGGLDLKVILKYIVDQVSTHLKVDAVGVLLFNPQILQLEFADGIGFRTPEIESTILRIGDGMAGAVASEQKTLYLPDLASSKYSQTALILREGFVSYFATPLIVKGQVKGVLEVFHRTRIDPGPAWVNFFELLAGQTAIAIDNAQLFEGLQHSNLELTLAYDETIEGWSRAMDLRDTDTEGHTQRVTELTITLAKLAGISDSEIVHIRRGALLHDMGKLGVPDSILLKPGPLTDEEWEIMHRHPLQAYQMLAPISYLRPALDIPYCHHEKWDGTGYPRGLKGEQIPLAARMFAVVDVYDALISDRPYRPAWRKEEAIEYIRTNSGAYFDPQIVEQFLKIVVEGD